MALTIRQQIGDRAGRQPPSINWPRLSCAGQLRSRPDAIPDGFDHLQQIGDRAGEAATWYQLGVLAIRRDKAVAGLRLIALCYLIDQAIGHADTESDFRSLVEWAAPLHYTQDQLTLLLREVEAAYQADRGQGLLEATDAED